MVKKKRQYRDLDELVIEHLEEDNNFTQDFLEHAFAEYDKDGNEAVLLIALRQVAQAQGGFTVLSKKTGLTRASLYKTLSIQGNPRLSTLRLILNALGYNLQFKHI